MNYDFRCLKPSIGYEELAEFIDLPDRILKSIWAVSSICHYNPGSNILREENPRWATYLILKGKVDIFQVFINGRRQVVLHLGPGEWFNFIPSLKPIGDNCVNVSASTYVRAAAIEDDDFRRLLRQYPEFAYYFLLNIANQVQQLIDLTATLSFLSTKARIADFLLKHVDRAGVIEWTCTQEDIGDRVGTVADVVGRTLRQFVDDGLIDIPSRHCIIIKNWKGLENEIK